MNVTVIAPHPDDETLGCGGTIRLHADQGDRVTALFLTSGELGLTDLEPQEARLVREGEARAAATILGIAETAFLRLFDWGIDTQLDDAREALSASFRRTQPDLVYLPHPGEWHPDHQVALDLTRVALERAEIRPELRLYEFWTPLNPAELVVDVTPVMATKVAALRCYQSQLEQVDYERAVVGLNQYRATLYLRNFEYAEAFHVDDGKMTPGPGAS